LVLDCIYSGLYPTVTILFDLIVKTSVESREARVSSCHDDILQIVVPDAFVCKLERLDNGSGDALLLESDVLRGEYDFWYLESFLVEGNVLGVDACMQQKVLSSMISAG
jgi:hypothetical protein